MEKEEKLLSVQCKLNDGDFEDVPDNSQLVLFYMPKFVCKIETEKFCRAAAHVSGSDRLDITDATYIQYYLADLVDTL